MYKRSKFHIPTLSPLDKKPALNYSLYIAYNRLIGFSIVAIHGFASHPSSAWTYQDGDGKSVNWLKDESMLPAVCPKARILAFGYDSMPVGTNPTRKSIPNIAMSLLEGLMMKRKDCPNRPIIFLGHCLGGLIALKVHSGKTIPFSTS